MTFFRKVVTLDIAGAWEQVNGRFLLPLLLGVVTSIFSLAQLVSWILTHYPVPLWAFFFGLILASALVLLQSVQQWRPIRILCLAAGTAVALSIALSSSVGLEMGYGGVFLAAFLAICAMILPGISGSFILVLLGMYNAVLLAIKSLDLTFILVFMIGAACGLMCFSRLLHWLLERFQQATMAVLTGFLFGSLAVVWPWKRVLVWIERSNGELKPAQQLPVMPADFELYTRAGSTDAAMPEPDGGGFRGCLVCPCAVGLLCGGSMMVGDGLVLARVLIGVFSCRAGCVCGAYAGPDRGPGRTGCAS